MTESSASVVVESAGSLEDPDDGGAADNEDDDGDDGDDPSPLLTLSVRPVSTRVEGSALLPGPLGKTRVPVGEALDAVAGLTARVLGGGGGRGSFEGRKGKSNVDSSSSSSCATLLEVTYLDENLRIGRTPRDGHLFVYAREEE